MVASWSLLLFLLLSFFGSFFSPCVYVCHALTYTHDCTCTKGVNMRNRLDYCAVWMLGESKRRKYYWRELLWQADCAITALALMAWLSNELPFAVMSSVFSALANFLIKFQLCEMSPPATATTITINITTLHFSSPSFIQSMTSWFVSVKCVWKGAQKTLAACSLSAGSLNLISC